jgi:hypothetical protein
MERALVPERFDMKPTLGERCARRPPKVTKKEDDNEEEEEGKKDRNSPQPPQNDPSEYCFTFVFISLSFR